MAKKKSPIRVTEHGGEAVAKVAKGGEPPPEGHEEGERPPTKEEWEEAARWPFTAEEWEEANSWPIELVTVPEGKRLAHERLVRRLDYWPKRLERFMTTTLPERNAALLAACRVFPKGTGAREMTGWDPGDPADRIILETIARWEALPSKEAFWTGFLAGEQVGMERHKAMASARESQRRAEAEELRKEETPEGRVRLTVKWVFLCHGCPRLNELVKLCQRPGSSVQAKRHGAEGHGTRWEFTYKGESWEPDPAALARTMQRWKAEA